MTEDCRSDCQQLCQIGCICYSLVESAATKQEVLVRCQEMAVSQSKNKILFQQNFEMLLDNSQQQEEQRQGQNPVFYVAQDDFVTQQQQFDLNYFRMFKISRFVSGLPFDESLKKFLV